MGGHGRFWRLSISEFGETILLVMWRKKGGDRETSGDHHSFPGGTGWGPAFRVTKQAEEVRDEDTQCGMSDRKLLGQIRSVVLAVWGPFITVEGDGNEVFTLGIHLSPWLKRGEGLRSILISEQLV